MAATIQIDTQTCTRCGRCVKVCPSLVLTQSSANTTVEIAPESCISCGHCAAVCPTNSVVHSHFPIDKVHHIDRAQLPTPQQLLLLCRSRRSNRALSDKPIPQEFLNQILEAAHRAPTASNRQQVSYTLITDPAKLRMVSQLTLDVFMSVARKLENPLLRPILSRLMPDVYKYLPAFHRMNREWESGRDMILRGATALILIHTPSDNRFGICDANLAYQNGSLMAEALGVSQFYTGFVYSAMQQDKRHTLARALGIEGTVHAGLALGMPQFTFPNYIDKKPIVVSQ